MLSTLLIGGCAELAAVGSALGTYGGTYAIETVQADADAVKAWNAKHSARVDFVVERCMNAAEKIESEGWEKAGKAYQSCLEFDEDNQPRILLERLKDRAARAKERRK